MPVSSGPVSGSTNIQSAPAPTDSGVCAISPSDLVGYTGNALNRIKELEQRVAELEAKIVQVNQLSDISQQIGWVGGITYMGKAGWTQTSYGTLIPPPGVSLSSLGFLMSDGNTYPMVVMDENGVLQYGFTNTGQMGGAGTANNKYVSFNTLTGSPGNALNLGAISATAGSWYTWNGTDTITISEKGAYAYSLILEGASADLNDNERFQAVQSPGWPFTHTTYEWAGHTDEDGRFFVGSTVIGIVTAAPCTFSITWGAGDDLSASLIAGTLTVVKLQSIA